MCSYRCRAAIKPCLTLNIVPESPFLLFVILRVLRLRTGAVTFSGGGGVGGGGGAERCGWQGLGGRRKWEEGGREESE